ncbi:MAG: hypothetical protein VXZ27_06640, partial [SAR324 cluster bacterium]|nr:hypothetical protein [SAR324 cluster bacterium]
RTSGLIDTIPTFGDKVDWFIPEAIATWSQTVSSCAFELNGNFIKWKTRFHSQQFQIFSLPLQVFP